MATTYASDSSRTVAARRGVPSVRAAQARRLSPAEMATLVLIAALLLAGPFATRQHAALSGATRPLQVETGDTLWSIAQEHPVAGLTTAQTVEAIVARNNIKGGGVSPGQTIVVPSAHDGDHLAMR